MPQSFHSMESAHDTGHFVNVHVACNGALAPKPNKRNSATFKICIREMVSIMELETFSKIIGVCRYSLLLYKQNHRQGFS